MTEYTEADLKEGIYALSSTLSKCEKALIKLKEGSPQHTLTTRRIKALRLAISLMQEKLTER